MKLVKITFLLAASLLLAGCSKTNTNKTSSNATNASASPKATVAKSPSGTIVETKISTPEAAADGLLEAWKSDDETAAARYATESAYKKLFKEGGGPEGMKSQGCSDEDGTYNCAYTYEGGALVMYVKETESSGYKVDSIEFIAD